MKTDYDTYKRSNPVRAFLDINKDKFIRVFFYLVPSLILLYLLRNKVFPISYLNAVDSRILPNEYYFKHRYATHSNASCLSGEPRIHVYDVPASLLNRVSYKDKIYKVSMNSCYYVPDPGYATEFIIHEEFRTRAKLQVNNLGSVDDFDLYFIPQYSVCVFHICLMYISHQQFGAGIDCSDLPLITQRK